MLYEVITANGNLVFLHYFQQGALHFRRGAIDLIGQDEIGKDGAKMRGELAGARVVNLSSNQVGWK